MLDPPPDFPREEPPLLRELDFEPLDLAGELLRELVFFTLPELRPDEPLDCFVFLLGLLRGLTVPLCRLVVVPLRLRLFTLSLRVRLEVPRLLVPVLRELVSVEFQTRVLRLRGWTDLLSLDVRVRSLCTLDRLLVALPVVRVLELALLPTVDGFEMPPALPPDLPLTRVVPRQLLVLPLTGTSPASRPSPAAVWRLRGVVAPLLAVPVVRPVSRIRKPL